MPLFSYRASTPEGRIFEGSEEAVSSSSLERMLAGRQLYPLEISPARAGEAARRRVGRRWRASRQVDTAEALATLSALLSAGLPLSRALEVAARGAARDDVALALDQARESVREGGRLADALREHPRLFPPAAIGLITAGEQGGHLDEAVRRLTEHLERDRAFRAQVLSALLYPATLLGVGALAIAVLVLFVVPRFVELVGDIGGELPASTRLLLTVSALGAQAWPAVAAFLLLGVLGLAAWRTTEEGRLGLDQFLLRVPVFGSLRAQRAAAQFARTLTTLLSGGLPLLPALQVASESTGDAAIATEIRGIREAVRRGETLSGALRRSEPFPHIFVRLVEVGEESGRLEPLLDRAGALLEADLQRRLERLIALIEPLLIVFFGILVGFVGLTLLQAIYGVHADVL